MPNLTFILMFFGHIFNHYSISFFLLFSFLFPLFLLFLFSFYLTFVFLFFFFSTYSHSSFSFSDLSFSFCHGTEILSDMLRNGINQSEDLTLLISTEIGKTIGCWLADILTLEDKVLSPLSVYIHYISIYLCFDLILL